MPAADLENAIKSEAARLGFSLFGVAPATDADGFDQFTAWLDKGYHGTMDYLRRGAEARRHPRSILPSVRSVVMLGFEYGAVAGEDDTVSPLPMGRVAKYARGPDYHPFLWDRLNELGGWLREQVPGSATTGVTDTAPLLERDFARRAGLGWVAKNTVLINPKRGSFFFLAGLLTDVPLKPDEPFTGSHCGTCTRCQDACPTDAFPEPFVLDATKCISYLTIELRSAVPEPLRKGIGDWLFGCDVCQDVCPWNRKVVGRPVAFPRTPELAQLDPVELLGLDANAFRQRFKATSLWRNKRAGVLRNAAIVLGNVGDERALPALEQALRDPEELIHEAAAWAIGRIRARVTDALPIA